MPNLKFALSNTAISFYCRSFLCYYSRWNDYFPFNSFLLEKLSTDRGSYVYKQNILTKKTEKNKKTLVFLHDIKQKIACVIWIFN